MSYKKVMLCLFAAFLILSYLQGALALTASIGNSRMILRGDVGESFERSLLIKNVNDVPVTINFEVTGDLADNIELKEEDFILLPEQEKKAYFTVKADEEGTSETKINVKFVPEQGSSVGLSATIIVIAGEAGDFESNNTEEENEPANESGFSFNLGKNKNSSSGLTGNSVSLPEISPVMWLAISSAILVLILVILVVYASKKRASKLEKKSPHEK